MNATTTPTIIGARWNGLLIVQSGHAVYLVHKNWFVAYGETAR